MCWLPLQTLHYAIPDIQQLEYTVLEMLREREKRKSVREKWLGECPKDRVKMDQLL